MMGVRFVGTFMYTVYFWACLHAIEHCERKYCLSARTMVACIYLLLSQLHTQTYRWITSVAVQLKEILLKCLDQTHSARMSLQLLSTNTVLSNTLYIPFAPNQSSGRWRRERLSLADVIYNECFSYEPFSSRIWSWWREYYRSRGVSIMRV